MAADMTALPALSAKIRTLPEEAKGYSVISVMSPADIQPLRASRHGVDLANRRANLG